MQEDGIDQPGECRRAAECDHGRECHAGSGCSGEEAQLIERDRNSAHGEPASVRRQLVQSVASDESECCEGDPSDEEAYSARAESRGLRCEPGECCASGSAQDAREEDDDLGAAAGGRHPRSMRDSSSAGIAKSAHEFTICSIFCHG